MGFAFLLALLRAALMRNHLLGKRQIKSIKYGINVKDAVLFPHLHNPLGFRESNVSSIRMSNLVVISTAGGETNYRLLLPHCALFFFVVVVV